MTQTVWALLVLLALGVVQGQCAVLYAGPEASGVNCTRDLPCSLQTACAAAVAMDTVQLLYGSYRLQNSPCIISSPNVSVVGSEDVRIECYDSCFVLEAIPFSLSTMQISSTGTSEPTAAIYGENVVCDTSDSLTISVLISNVSAQVTNNNLFFVSTEFSFDYIGAFDITFEDTIVSGNGTTDAEVGCIGAQISSTSMSWTFSSLTVDGYTSYTAVPFLDVAAYSAATSLVVDGLHAVNSDLFAVIGAGFGDYCTIENAVIERVQNYGVVPYSSPLIALEFWGNATLTDVSFTNIPSDTSGLLSIQAQNLELSGLTVTGCSGKGAAEAVYTSCWPDSCVHSITAMEITNATYASFALHVGDSNSTLAIGSSSFTDVVSFEGAALMLDSSSIVLNNLTFTGGQYAGGAISISDPISIDATTILADTVDASYAFVSVSADNVGSADLNFDDVVVEDSVIVNSIFFLGPGDAEWEVTISNSDFGTTGANTTAVVTCYGNDSDTGEAAVLVESSTCDLGDACALQDSGYVDAGVCTFAVDDASYCEVCAPASDGGYEGHLLVGVLGIAVVVCIIIAIVVAVIVAVVVVRKHKHGYRSI